MGKPDNRRHAGWRRMGGRVGRIVTLLTDFGVSDPYVAETKGAILSRCREASIVDITHEVTPFHVKQAAFLLLLAYRFFPPWTVHVAVVDPGVGTGRRAIVVRSRNYWFVGPDNGVLYPASKSDGIEECFEIVIDSYPRIGGETFHARDIFGPVAGELASGAWPRVKRISEGQMVRLEISSARFVEGAAEAEVLHVDRFGNAILNIDASGMPPTLKPGREVRLGVRGEDHRAKYVKAYGDAANGDLLVTIGGTGLLEIAVNRGSAASMLGLRPGDRVTVRVD